MILFLHNKTGRLVSSLYKNIKVTLNKLMHHAKWINWLLLFIKNQFQKFYLTILHYQKLKRLLVSDIALVYLTCEWAVQRVTDVCERLLLILHEKFWNKRVLFLHLKPACSKAHRKLLNRHCISIFSKEFTAS